MPVIVFDGICGLCNGWVDFLLRVDRRRVFRFTPSQSEAGTRLLDEHGLVSAESVVLVDGVRAWTESDAVIEILRRLGGPWGLAAVGRVVPRGLRDGLYRAVARNRYRWFGRRETCRLPTPDERQRFL